MSANETEARRLACEIEWILRQPRAERMRYFGMVERSRGTEAARRLDAQVRAEFKRRMEKGG